MATHRLVIDPPATLMVWGDDSAENASRLYPQAGQPTKVWRVVVPASGSPVGVDVRAIDLATNAALPEGSLGGNSFMWSWGFVPPGRAQTFIDVDADTSLATITLSAAQAGLWLLTCWRNQNGAASIPIECVVE